MDPFIKAENLSVIYNIGKTSEFTALSDVSLKIFSGEYIVFFGPSGCGKSTLLNCLAGLEVPTSGKVFMKNEDLTAFTLQQLITHRRLRIGMVFQNYNLIPTLNILDNVTLPYILGGYTPNFAKEKANILLERFGIPNLKSRYPSELSGGQKQRAAIARSLMYHPPILLADEPVGNLDSESARIVMEVLVELNEKNKETIILVTHDPSYLKFGHRIFYMKDGKIIREAVNYDKKQIYSQSIKEKSSENAEYKRLAQAHPHFSESQLKAKMILNHLVYPYSVEIQQKIEEIISQYLLKQIDKQEMLRLFDIPVEDGGVSLYKQTAKKLAEQVAKVSEQIKIVEDIKKDKSISPAREKVISISKSLLTEYSGNLSEGQTERMQDAVADFLFGKIDSKKFRKKLDESFNSGGVGLNRRTALDFARKIELIISK